jgi:putative DNA primase/helicase
MSNFNEAPLVLHTNTPKDSSEEGGNLPPAPVASYRYGAGRFELSENGVHFIGPDKDGKKLQPQFVCGPLHVVANTRDEQSRSWGLLLQWPDIDGVIHQWAMPLELLEGDALSVRRELAEQGLRIAANRAAGDLLTTYIKVWPASDKVRCVSRLGWYESVFVTTQKTIGDGAERVVFQQPQHAVKQAISSAGTVEQWRAQVAALAAGNSRLAFVLSAGFAGTLARLVGEESGGFHFRGGSSCGKSTLLKAMASIWGNPSDYVRHWRSTVNGLEGLASIHNDGVLILDELGQIDPMAAGDAAYLLANGQGKARATRNGMSRPPQQWCLIFVSAGEESLAGVMARAGQRTTAGQEIRMAEIEADAGFGMGIVENLHGYATSGDFIAALKAAAKLYYGEVGNHWLQNVVADRLQLITWVKEFIERFTVTVTPANAVGQVERIARRFGLVAAAGELATQYGLTGWHEHEGTSAARVCFQSWFDGFGGGISREARSILEHVRSFIETHGASRFEQLNGPDAQRIPNRAGFYRNGANGMREYLVLPAVFRREICGDFDQKTVKKALIDVGALVRGKDGKPSQNVRLPDLGSPKIYVLRYPAEDA